MSNRPENMGLISGTITYSTIPVYMRSCSRYLFEFKLSFTSSKYFYHNTADVVSPHHSRSTTDLLRSGGFMLLFSLLSKCSSEFDSTLLDHWVRCDLRRHLCFPPDSPSYRQSLLPQGDRRHCCHSPQPQHRRRRRCRRRCLSPHSRSPC